MNNPTAFTETYWSINSLRVYNESGKPAKSSSLSAGAIAGIVIGSIAGLLILGLLFWRWRKRRNQKRIMVGGDGSDSGDDINIDRDTASTPTPKPYSFLGTKGANLPTLGSGMESASSSRSNLRSGAGAGTAKTIGINPVPKNPKGNIQANGYAREGKTKLAPGKSARHYLAGETPLAPKIPSGATSPEGGSRRGSAASGAFGTGAGGDWVVLASGGSRRASQAPSVSGRGWVG
jgi:hypothetical protein